MFGDQRFSGAAFFSYCETQICSLRDYYGFQPHMVWDDLKDNNRELLGSFGRYKFFSELVAQAKKGEIISDNGYFTESALRRKVKQLYCDYAKRNRFSRETDRDDVQDEIFYVQCQFAYFSALRHFMINRLSGTMDEAAKMLKDAQVAA